MYYLSPLVRVTRGRRLLWAPVGIGETETSWIIIGDRAILWARDPIADARLKALAEGREERLAAATRSALGERIKDREFRGTDSFVDTIASLLRAPGQNPWAALRPSKRRGRYEILLGPREDRLFWSQAAPPRKNTVVYTDNFTGNGNLDGRNFSGGGSQWEVLDGSMATSGGVLQTNNIPVDTYAQAVALADADTDELFAQVTQTAWSINAGNRYMESNLGVATNDDLSAGYFMFRVESNLEGNETGIFAVFSEELVDDNNPEFVQTGTIRIERDGSTVRGYVDDEEILSGTHTGEPTGTGFRKAAIQSYAGWVSTNDLAWDDFSYGDLAAGSEPVEVTPPAAETVVDAPNPTVATGASVIATVAATIMTALAPSVQTGAVVTPPAAVTHVAALDPVVSTGVNITPPVAATVVQAPDPTIQTSVDVQPPVAATVHAAPDPTVTTGVNVTPAVAASVAAALNPAVATGASVSPPAAATTVAALDPAVQTGATVQPPAAATVVTAPNPTIGTAVIVAPPAGQTIVTALDPAVAAGATVTPPVAATVMVAPDPAAGASIVVSPPAAATVVTALDPTITTGAAILPPPAVTTVTAPDPTIGVGVHVQPPVAATVMVALEPLQAGAGYDSGYYIDGEVEVELDGYGAITVYGAGDGQFFEID